MRSKLALLIAAFAIAAVSCGSGDRNHSTASRALLQPTPVAATAPIVASEISLDSALEELRQALVPQGVDAAVFNMLRDELARQLSARAVSKVALSAPTGPINAITDLTVGYGGGGFELHWRYRNVGDYNQDGIIGVSDITPIAQHYNETWPDGGENMLIAVADGSGDHKVEISDVTPIAANFGCNVEDYVIEAGAQEVGPFTEVGTLAFEECASTDTARGAFTASLPLSDLNYFRVIPRDSDGAQGDASSLAPVAPRISAVSPLTITVGLDTQLSGVVRGTPPYVFGWEFPAGVTPEISFDETPHILITAPGEYQCRVTVTSDFGQAYLDFTLTAGLAPSITFVSSLDGTPGDSKVLSATVEGTPPLTYAWDCAGGASPNQSNVVSPSVTLSAEGDYVAALTVTNAYGTDNENFSIHVTDNWWHNEVVDTGGVGTAPILAFGNDGNPSIAYFDNANGNLKYAHYSGTGWQIETVDPAGTVNYFCSLAFDVDGYPGISYFDYIAMDLKFAHWNGLTWDISVVDSAGNVGSCSSVVYLNSGNPAISYYDDTNHVLKYAEQNGPAWDFTSIAPGGGYDSSPYSDGYTWMHLDGTGNPVISFYRVEALDMPDLFLARRNGVSWVVETVKDYVSTYPLYFHMALDADNNPVFSYPDSHIALLNSWNGSAWEESPIATVQDLSYESAIAFDSAGIPVVVTYGADDGFPDYYMSFSLWTGSGWYTGIIDDSSPVIGQYLSLAMSPSDIPCVAYYDMTNGYLKFSTYY